MARTVYAFREGKFVEIASDERIKPRTEIISDEMVPTRHPVTGKMYTSTKKFRADTAATGCVEVGDQAEPWARQLQRQRVENFNRDDPSLGNDLARAFDELSRNGRKRN